MDEKRFSRIPKDIFSLSSHCLSFLSHSKAKPYMTKEHLTKFINKKQRNSHLNEVLFPPAKPGQVQGLIEKYEPSGMNIQRGESIQMSFLSFFQA